MNKAEKRIDEPYAKQVYAKQVRTLYGSFMVGIAGTFIGAFLLMAIQWDFVDHSYILMWFALFSAFHLIRAVFVYRFNKVHPDDGACVVWGQGFVYSSIVAGMIWSLGIVITFAQGNLTYQLTVAIITVGLGAGAVSAISMLRFSFIAFVFPIMFTLVVLFLMEKTTTTNILSIIIFLTMLFIMRGANNIYVSNKNNFRLLMEAEDREKQLIIAKESAEIANKTQAEFLDNMSHELRTPLHGILAFTELGINSANDCPDEKFLRYFSKISESGKRLKILLDDLLDLRKIEDGKMELNFESNDMEKIINSCIEEQEAFIISHQLKVDFNSDNVLPFINCDKHRVGQVIMNLLSNAIKFSPEGGHITFFVKIVKNTNNSGEAIRISITDQGPGIPPDEHESVFNKFVQVKKQASNTGGTGLGLAICKEIIKEHKGSVWCENNDGPGVTFSFILPV
ncbi:MAG: hypothetical protein KAT06_11795 [Gammaproteobacteria bacterium]|nr:hypothetical protein [Gammaproteobacteria bacterium]